MEDKWSLNTESQNKRYSSKEEFIANYMNKHMSGHNLPYSFAYFDLLNNTEEKAEIAWETYKKRHSL